MKWRVELREDDKEWWWDCFDGDVFVCNSDKGFRWRWQAVRNFELRFADHWSQIAHRFAIPAHPSAAWVCGR